MKKDDEDAVRRICASHRWKVLTTGQIGLEVFPNMMLGALDNDTKYGALRTTRRGSHADWSASAGGLDYLLAAKTGNRVDVGVVLLCDPNGALVVVESIETVMQNLQGIEPHFGKWGQFYWLNAAFMSAANSGAMTNASDGEVF